MRVSDHQPFLFGHEGYWSKIAAADVHVVMADVRYRPEDKLTTCRLSDTISFAGMLRSSVQNPRIADMDLTKANKLRASVEQLLMNKSMPYRDRLAPMLPMLLEGQPYLSLWLQMSIIVSPYLPGETKLDMALEPPSGTTPFGRNLNRLSGRGIPSEGTEYVCGPALQQYVDLRSEQCPMPLLLHTMQNPSPISFVRRIVTELDPRLPSPRLEPLSL